MIGRILLISTLFNVLFSFSQVGIGTTTPDSESILDIQSNNKGLLIPRLSDHTTIMPTSGNDYGLLVFDTTTKSFWYWDSVLWNELSITSKSWNLAGNTGTSSVTDFLGTADAQDIVFKTNGTERLRILSDGNVSINNNTPSTSNLFTVQAPVDDNAILGFATGTGIAVFGYSTDTYALYGISDTSDGVVGFTEDESETGVAASNDISDGLYSTLVNGSGIAGEGFSTGVYGVANDTDDSAFGGYFINDGSYSYVGGWELSGGSWTNYKIKGSGSVSTIVKGVEGDLLTMACPESPEILFQDYGVGKLVNGFSRISIDPNFSKNIRVDNQHPLKVFIQLEGDCKGVFVTNKSANSFDVKELQGGASNVEFSWQIVATRADEKVVLKDGRIRISNNGWRFARTKGPLATKEVSVKEIKK